MKTMYYVLVARGIDARSLFTTESVSEALFALETLADLAPDLRLVLYVSAYSEPARRVLTVTAGSWRVTDTSAFQQAAA